MIVLREDKPGMVDQVAIIPLTVPARGRIQLQSFGSEVWIAVASATIFLSLSTAGVPSDLLVCFAWLHQLFAVQVGHYNRCSGSSEAKQLMLTVRAE